MHIEMRKKVKFGVVFLIVIVIIILLSFYFPKLKNNVIFNNQTGWNSSDYFTIVNVDKCDFDPYNSLTKFGDKWNSCEALREGYYYSNGECKYYKGAGCTQLPFVDEENCRSVCIGASNGEKHYCTLVDRQVACPETNLRGNNLDEPINPVCGWLDPSKVNCVRYPCAGTYDGGCNACKNENVEYWTEGECPK